MGQTPQKITKQWADGPFKLLDTPKKRLGYLDAKTVPGHVKSATDMALIHNVFARVLNCIYLQASNVKTAKDISDFAIFMDSWVITIHEHHGNEEKLFFPRLEEMIGIPNYLGKNVEQHHAFAPGFDKFEVYVKALRAGTVEFDAVKVRGLIDGFGEILINHLGEEIDTLLECERFGDKIDWPAWDKYLEEIAVGTADKYYEIPMVMSNIDYTFEDGKHAGWPGLPWFVVLMFRWMYTPKHKGAWRFSSCDDKGMPRDLPLV